VFAETALLLGRVATVEDEASRQDAVEHVIKMLTVKGLSSVNDSEPLGITYHFEILNLLPALHNLTADAAEQKIVEFATPFKFVQGW